MFFCSFRRSATNPYFDGAAAGLDLIKSKYDHVTTEVITMGEGEEAMANYPSFFEEACAGKQYDLIITGGGEVHQRARRSRNELP